MAVKQKLKLAPATAEQMEEIRQLLAERTKSRRTAQIRKAANNLYLAGILTTDTAPQIIKRLQAVPKDVDLMPPGLYAIDGQSQDTDFYRIREDNRVFQLFGYPGAWRHENLPWNVAALVVAKIRAAGLQESAARFGREMGVCAMCESPLSNEKSRELGIGPECRKKLR